MSEELMNAKVKYLVLKQENEVLKLQRQELLKQVELLRKEVENLALEIQMLRSSSGEWILTSGTNSAR